MTTVALFPTQAASSFSAEYSGETELVAEGTHSYVLPHGQLWVGRGHGVFPDLRPLSDGDSQHPLKFNPGGILGRQGLEI